jgi:hypothetical protein
MTDGLKIILNYNISIANKHLETFQQPLQLG